MFSCYSRFIRCQLTHWTLHRTLITTSGHWKWKHIGSDIQERQSQPTSVNQVYSDTRQSVVSTRQLTPNNQQQTSTVLSTDSANNLQQHQTKNRQGKKYCCRQHRYIYLFRTATCRFKLELDNDKSTRPLLSYKSFDKFVDESVKQSPILLTLLIGCIRHSAPTIAPSPPLLRT